MSAYVLSISPMRKPARIRPLKAMRHMRQLIADKEDTEQVFHIIEALNGDALKRNLQRFAKTQEGQACLREKRDLPAHLDQHDWIRTLPEGTVGRAYVAFMEREGLTAKGLVDESMKVRSGQQNYDDDISWFASRMRDTHDLFHVLTGYGRDALGEAALLAFTYSQNPGRGVKFIAYVGARQLHKHLPKKVDVMACYREGKRNGRTASFIAAQDIFALLEEPLDAARARLNISEPVAYKHALQVCADAGIIAGDIQPTAA